MPLWWQGSGVVPWPFGCNLATSFGPLLAEAHLNSSVLAKMLAEGAGTILRRGAQSSSSSPRPFMFGTSLYAGRNFSASLYSTPARAGSYSEVTVTKRLVPDAASWYAKFLCRVPTFCADGTLCARLCQDSTRLLALLSAFLVAVSVGIFAHRVSESEILEVRARPCQMAQCPIGSRRYPSCRGVREFLSDDKRDRVGIVAPPPLIYMGTLVLGLVLSRRFPMPFLPRTMTRALGWPLVIGGVLLLSWFERAMHRAGTPANPYKPVSGIVTEGPFRYTRNPAYLSMTLIYAGVAFLARALWAVLLLPVALHVIRRGVIEREERYLERKFGEEYLHYKASVRRWI
jgi:protein-S-isoprenylcysteine O-methyltransferase Ste14